LGVSKVMTSRRWSATRAWPEHDGATAQVRGHVPRAAAEVGDLTALRVRQFSEKRKNYPVNWLMIKGIV
jgi:hypothetical protein